MTLIRGRRRQHQEPPFAAHLLASLSLSLSLSVQKSIAVVAAAAAAAAAAHTESRTLGNLTHGFHLIFPPSSSDSFFIDF